jgi:hypothetical protein
MSIFKRNKQVVSVSKSEMIKQLAESAYNEALNKWKKDFPYPCPICMHIFNNVYGGYTIMSVEVDLQHRIYHELIQLNNTLPGEKWRD